MAYPKISIVTPSYNQGPFIEQTIRSVILQRYPNLEYIMMDGGSKDETVEIIDRYERHFAHAQSAPDRGQSDAIRNGLARSTGDIMAYLNSDDLLAPDALFEIADFFERNPKIDVVYSHRCAIDEKNLVIWYWQLPPHNTYLMKRWDLIPQETTFWRRAIYEKVGGIDASFRFAMDYDLFTKFMLNGRLARNDRFHGAFRQHSESKTSRLLETVGRAEIERVWHDHGIRSHKADRFLGVGFTKGVEIASAVFTQNKRFRPGILPGSLYLYDRIWGNQLRGGSVPV